MYVVVGVVVLIISNRREIQGRNYDAGTKAFEAIRATTCSAKIATIPPPQKKKGILQGALSIGPPRLSLVINKF